MLKSKLAHFIILALTTVSWLFAADEMEADLFDRQLILHIATNEERAIWLPCAYEFNEEHLKLGETTFFSIGSATPIKIPAADPMISLVFSLIGSVRERAKVNDNISPGVVFPKEDMTSTRSLHAQSIESYLILNGIMHSAVWSKIDAEKTDLKYNAEKVGGVYAGYVPTSDKSERCCVVIFRLTEGRSVALFHNSIRIEKR